MSEAGGIGSDERGARTRQSGRGVSQRLCNLSRKVVDGHGSPVGQACNLPADVHVARARPHCDVMVGHVLGHALGGEICDGHGFLLCRSG
mgnify:CR=1 FL=1